MSRSRKKILIKGGRGIQTSSRIELNTPSQTELEEREYLSGSYGPENFNSKLSTLKKSDQKVTIIRNGLEFQQELYTRE